jgi:hypothetical protein
MDSLAQIGILTMATVFAGVTAFGMAWAFLCGAFRLMQPAAVRTTRPVRSELVHGVRAAARQFVRS